MGPQILALGLSGDSRDRRGILGTIKGTTGYIAGKSGC